MTFFVGNTANSSKTEDSDAGSIHGEKGFLKKKIMMDLVPRELSKNLLVV